MVILYYITRLNYLLYVFIMRFHRPDFDSSGVTRRNLDNQRGAGIGLIFSSIFKALLPLAKSALGIGAKAAKSSVGKKVLGAAKDIATSTGKDILADALAGENIATSVKKRVGAATKKAALTAAKTAKRTALDAGLDIVQDTLQGKSLKGSAKRRIKQAARRLQEEVEASETDSETAEEASESEEEEEGSRSSKRRTKKKSRSGKKTKTMKAKRARRAARGTSRRKGRGSSKKRSSGKRGGRKSRSGKKIIRIKKNSTLGKQLVRQWL